MPKRLGGDHEGRLIESFRSPEGRAGLLWFKGVELGLPGGAFPRPGIYFPRGTTRVRVIFDGKGAKEIAANQVLVVPPGQAHRVVAQTRIVELAVFLPDASIMADVAELYEQHADRVARAFEEPFVGRRARWLDECHHRYVFERVVCKHEGNTATSFLETEITKEIYFLRAQPEEERGCFTSLFDVDSPARRAMAILERDLFEPMHLDRLATLCGASRSTLLRSFRKEFGVSPQQYARDRRLDEAWTMLARGLSVSEVAATVGYESVSAFSQAFRRKFRRTPTGG